MSVKPVPPGGDEREARLLAIRREAELSGQATGLGVRPPGAPFPMASPETGYYGIPVLKEPQWTWQIPLYFFVGGVAGPMGVIGSVADWVGDDYELARKARMLAVGGAILSGGLLTWDLGRPSRFMNMLRVFKPQSAMSMGAWLLAGFSSAASASLFADIVGQRLGKSIPVKLLSGVGRLGSIAFGGPFHNYTGVLIGATAIPTWNENVHNLPVHFGMSGLEAAVGLLELMGHSRSRALNALGIISATAETMEGFKLETNHRRTLRPLKRGTSGWITRTGGVLSGPFALSLRVIAALSGEERSSRLRKLAAVAGVTGSLLTRIGWLAAGHASARDWRSPMGIPEPAEMMLPAGESGEASVEALG